MMKTLIPLNCILLVDDDSINNFINIKILRKIGASEKVKTALNGQEALEYIKEFCQATELCCPDLIFLDINMPVMNGFEFLEAYRHLKLGNKCKVKIVVLTTSTNPSDLDRIRDLGITDFLSKPLTEEKVLKYLS